MLRYIFIINRILLVLLWGLYVLHGQGVLKQDNLQKSDIVVRLTTLQQFVPHKHYKWHMRWLDRGVPRRSVLEGVQQGKAHWIDIKFSDEIHLIFDKNNPCIALYPNKLCLRNLESFTMPISGLPGLCIYMIAMPFLRWDIVDYAQTAKLGRRAIQIRLTQDHFYCELFLDKNFNTILQVQVWDDIQHFHSSFSLKRLKKFKAGWGVRTAVFTLNGHKTSLYVDDIIAID